MDLNKAILYGQLVQAAYDIPTTDLSNKAGQTRDAGLGANETTFEIIASIYANDLATDASKKRGPVAPVSIGLLLWHAGSGEAVIAIRGTEGIHEWVQDAQFDTVPCKLLPGAGETEDGFTDMYNSFGVSAPGGQAVTAALATIFGTRQVNSLTVSGHSLGGALATLQALDAAANSKFKNPTVYTYASPRTGDAQFVNIYNVRVPNTFRIANRVDVVPKLPFSPPYEHVQGLFTLSAIQFFPPAILVEPNPLCEHVLETYLHLLSKLARVGPIALRQGCATPGGVTKLLNHLKMEFRGDKKMAENFAKKIQ
jgi:hypothetical protein